MRPQSKNMGKVLKIEIVRAYFSQVYRIPTEEMQEQWQAFKMRTLQACVADESLTQEQLRTISLACKEHCRKRKKAVPSGTISIPERQTAVA